MCLAGFLTSRICAALVCQLRPLDLDPECVLIQLALMKHPTGLIPQVGTAQPVTGPKALRLLGSCRLALLTDALPDVMEVHVVVEAAS